MGLSFGGLHLIARDDVEELVRDGGRALDGDGRATRMVVMIPCSSRWNAAEVADNFWWEVVRYHGLPRSIISDRGPVFVSEFWTEMMKFLDIDASKSSPYHPQAKGQAERTNQTLKQVLRTLLLSQD